MVRLVKFDLQQYKFKTATAQEYTSPAYALQVYIDRFTYISNNIYIE